MVTNFESECGDCGVSASPRNTIGNHSGAIGSRPTPLLNVVDHDQRRRPAVPDGALPQMAAADRRRPSASDGPAQADVSRRGSSLIRNA